MVITVGHNFPNRSKQDEQLEKAIEDFFRNWKVSLPVLGIAGGFLLFKNQQILPLEWLASTGRILILYAGIALLWVIVSVVAWRIWTIHYNMKNYEYVQLLPHADDFLKPEQLSELMRRMHGTKRGWIRRLIYGRERYSFLIHAKPSKKQGGIEYLMYLGAPKDRLRPIRHHLNAHYAHLEFYPADDLIFPEKAKAEGRLGLYRNRDKAALSLARYKADHLPGILKVMAADTWLQVGFSADSEYRLKKRITDAEKVLKKGKPTRSRSAFDREEEFSYKKRYYGNEVSFEVTVALATNSPRQRGALQETATAIEATMSDVNELRFKMVGRLNKYPFPFPYKMVWTGSELANLFHLPDLTAEGVPQQVAKQIPHATRGMQKMPGNVLSSESGYTIGTLVHPLLSGREVKILPQAFTKHWGLTGKTGSGKSTLLNQILRSMIDAWVDNPESPGFSFIDPKKETATIVLNHLLAEEQRGKTVDWSRVRWVSFKDAETPPAMNLLYRMEGVPDIVLTDQIMRVIKESGFGVAPQAERLLSKSIQALLADHTQTHTILGVRPLLLDRRFQEKLLRRLENDPANAGLIQFWREEAEDLMKVSGQPILNRIDLFADNDFLRRIFGQTDFRFPIRQWMDEGYLVFYDFSGMSEEEAGLIGSYLAYLYYRIADTRPDRSLLHSFVIDEAQRVKASILPVIIAEMRSKGLSMGVANQTLDQLPEQLQHALTDIASNMFICKQGEKGAAIGEKAFKRTMPNGKDATVFTAATLKALPARTAVIKTEDQIDGMEQTVYAMINVPPLDRFQPNGKVARFGDDKQAKAEIERSNAWTHAKAKELESRNGKPIAEIDKDINLYLGYATGPIKETAPLPSIEPDEKAASPFDWDLIRGGKDE